jgi:hypothetical protein
LLFISGCVRFFYVLTALDTRHKGVRGADDLLAEDFSATLIPAGKARTSVLFQAPNFSLIYTKLS